MKVRATAPGYHGYYREIGDEFEVDSGATAEWFEPVAGKKQDAKVDAGKTSKDDGAKA